MVNINFYIPLLTAVALLVGCNNEAKRPGDPRDTAAAVQPVSKIPDSVQQQRLEMGQVDTSDGTLTLTGTGAENGTWKFDDVTATASERTLAGATQSLLTLEAHDGLANRHFRVRLRGDVGTLKTGTYRYGPQQKEGMVRLEVRFENAGKTYNSAVGGSGELELTRFDDRAAGKFSCIVPPLSTSGGDSVQLQGSFDQKVK